MAWCHSTCSNRAALDSGFWAAGSTGWAGASDTSRPAKPKRNVWLGGSSPRGPTRCAPLAGRSAANESIEADPRTSATAGTVRVASRRLRARWASSRRRRDASSPVATGPPNDGSGGNSRASAANGSRGCSRNQSTSTSNQTSSRRQPMDEHPSSGGAGVLRILTCGAGRTAVSLTEVPRHRGHGHYPIRGGRDTRTGGRRAGAASGRTA